MAKKGKRPEFMLECSKCKLQDYRTDKNIINTPDRLELKKYCKTCKKVTLHKETK